MYVSEYNFDAEAMNCLYETMGRLDPNTYKYFATCEGTILLFPIALPDLKILFKHDGIIYMHYRHLNEIFDCQPYYNDLPRRREAFKSTLGLFLQKIGKNIVIPEFETYTLKY